MLRPVPAALLAAILATACSPAGLLNGLDRVSAPGGPSRVASAISFAADPQLKLDVYAPTRHPQPGARLPIVVFFYGGGWVGGARGDYGFAGRAFASNGFVTIIPDYRKVPQVRFPTFVEDGALAVKWARDHAAEFGGDPRRITLSGHSAGAYNAAMLALDQHFLRDVGVDPRTVRAAALLAGPYDFYPFTEQRGRDALGAWPRPAETQPISFARPDAPPLLLAAGTADTVVNPGNSERLAARLRSQGARVELRLYQGKSHVDLVKALSVPFRGSSPVLADSVAFLRAHSR